MATIVTGEQYMMIDGKLHEIKRQLRQKGGYPHDPEQLDRALQAIVNGRFEAAKSALPTEMTLGGVTYEILSFLKGDEKSVVGSVMLERAKEMNANLGQEDCDRLLAHWSDIPPVLRGKISFVFPGYRHPGGRESVACVDWGGGGWCQCWGWLGHDWGGRGRLLRRQVESSDPGTLGP